MISASQVSLISAVALAIYITRRCILSPNAPPTQRHDRDTLYNITLLTSGPQLASIALVIGGVFHSIIIARSSNLASLPLCPHPDHINMTYFTWTAHTIICLGVIYTFGVLRIMAFGSLGKSFTFELAKPDKLITTGMYAYVQHPSYTCLIMVVLATARLFLPPDAAIGCVLPWWLIEKWIQWKWSSLAGVIIVVCSVIRVRVKEEETMLKEAFGKDWVVWHRTTPRFIPFLF